MFCLFASDGMGPSRKDGGERGNGHGRPLLAVRCQLLTWGQGALRPRAVQACMFRQSSRGRSRARTIHFASARCRRSSFCSRSNFTVRWPSPAWRLFAVPWQPAHLAQRTQYPRPHRHACCFRLQPYLVHETRTNPLDVQLLIIRHTAISPAFLRRRVVRFSSLLKQLATMPWPDISLKNPVWGLSAG